MAWAKDYTKRLQKNGNNTAYKLHLYVNETNVDTANNQSTIAYEVAVEKLSGTGYWSNDNDGHVERTIDGSSLTEINKPYDFRNTTSVTFSSGTRTIQHNPDGTKILAIKAYFKDKAGNVGSGTASGNFTLTKINTGVEPTFSDNPATLGSQITITHTNTNTAFKFNFKFKINGNIVDTLENITSDSTNYTPPLTWANYFPNSKTGSCVLTLETYDYNTGNLIGSKDATLNLIIPDSVKPSVSIGTPVEINATMISKNWGVFVEGKSQVKIPITATGIYGSSINSVSASVNGINAPGNYDADNDVWNFTTNANTSGTNTISSSATDSRTNTGTDTDTFNVVAYSNPSISNVEIQRCLSDGTIDNNGTYVKYSFNGSISPVSNHNTASWKISYKKTTDANYTDVTLGTGYTYATTPGGDVSSFTISTDYTYDIKISGTDAFTTAEYHEELDTGFDLMNFNSSGKSMALGKVSEATALEEKLEVGLTTDFLEPITATTIDATSGDFDTLNIADGTANLSSLTILHQPVLMPYVLYDGNESRTDTDITLDDSAGNYQMLEIFYNYYNIDDAKYKSTRVYEPDGKIALIEGSFANSTYLYFESARYTISGTSLTRTSAYRWRFRTDGNATRTDTTTNDPSIWITRVVGYK